MCNYEFVPGAVIIDGEKVPVRYVSRPGRVVIIPENENNDLKTFEIPEVSAEYDIVLTIADEAARAAVAAPPPSAEQVQPSAEQVQPSAEQVQPSAEQVQPSADPVQAQRPEIISDPAPAAEPAPAPVPRFTTRSMIIGAERFRVRYALNDNGALVITGERNEKSFSITLNPDHKYYAAARAAYDEKAEKRAKYDAEKDDGPDKWFIGQELKGPGWTIKMDGSIDRATVTFQRKPSLATRELVKAAGFYWSPVHKQWSRGLTHKAWRAAQELYKQLSTPAAKRAENISA